MSRLLGISLAATVLVSACKIERTPPEYFDHRTPREEDIALAEEELRSRLAIAGQALAREDVEQAWQALAPSEGVAVLGPEGEEQAAGVFALERVFQQIARAPGGASLSDVEVSVGPRANVAWMAAHVELAEPSPTGGTLLRFTGVYLRVDGAWNLVQAHLSYPIPPSPSPAAAGDSVGAE